MKKPTIHRMTRRAAAHDYSRPGLYHVTLHVADGGGHPFGHLAGDASAPDGTPDAPRVVLTAVGHMVEHELLHTIRAHYPMVRIDTYVIMPEHVHVLFDVTDHLLNHSGKATHLGQVIAGFKYGCAKKCWQMRQAEPAATAPGGLAAGSAAHAAPAAPAVPAVPGGSAAHAAPAAPAAPGGLAAGSAPGFPPLFAPGYCDVMPVDAAQLATQRAYIAANPRSRLLRSSNREWLQTQRGGIDTAVTPSALSGYLRRECAPSQSTPEALAQIACRLLQAGGTIACDSYGDRSLLQRCLLPVVCHRRDKARLAEQKARCLQVAARGAVLVSPRIAQGEQEIIAEAVNRGFPVILIADNGFPERFHPSQERLDRCAAGRLLIVTPWQYRYRPKDDAITVAECKTMNCVAQALCRLKDTWWQTPAPGALVASIAPAVPGALVASPAPAVPGALVASPAPAVPGGLVAGGIESRKRTNKI